MLYLILEHSIKSLQAGLYVYMNMPKHTNSIFPICATLYCSMASSALNSKGRECVCDVSCGGSSSTNQRSNPRPRKSSTKRHCGVTMAFKDYGETEGWVGRVAFFKNTNDLCTQNEMKLKMKPSFFLAVDELIFINSFFLPDMCFYMNMSVWLYMSNCFCKVCRRNCWLWSVNIWGDRSDQWKVLVAKLRKLIG